MAGNYIHLRTRLPTDTVIFARLVGAWRKQAFDVEFSELVAVVGTYR